MRGGEKIRRGRLSCEEQAAVDGVGAPTRFRKRLQAAAEIRAEQACDLVERLRCECALAGVFQGLRKASAEKAFDTGLAERAQMIGAHLGAHGGGTQIALLG